MAKPRSNSPLDVAAREIIHQIEHRAANGGNDGGAPGPGAGEAFEAWIAERLRLALAAPKRRARPAEPPIDPDAPGAPVESDPYLEWIMSKIDDA